MTMLPMQRNCDFQGRLLKLNHSQAEDTGLGTTKVLEAKGMCQTQMGGDILDNVK